MSEFESDVSPELSTPAAPRKRPKPGERRVQILQALATMLEQPGSERITTSALAARLEVSEAALYRHFASKAQMFEGLIEFIEQTVFPLVNQIAERETDPTQRTRRLVIVCITSFTESSGAQVSTSRIISLSTRIANSSAPCAASSASYSSAKFQTCGPCRMAAPSLAAPIGF